MHSFRTVVVATDFSEFSEQAIACAKSMAARFGAALHVIHVREDVSAAYAVVEGPLPDVEGMQMAVDRDAERRLDQCLTDAERCSLPARTVLLPSSPAAQAIVDYARDQPSPVIVLGTHGRTGIARLLLGSVAEHVVRTAPCPVMTVHAGVSTAEVLSAKTDEALLAGVAS